MTYMNMTSSENMQKIKINLHFKILRLNLKSTKKK